MAAIAAVSLTPAPSSAQEGAVAALEARIAKLSERAKQLESISAIKRLQRAYGYYLDAGQWAEAGALFAREGTLEIGMDGIYSGPDRIADYLSERLGGHSSLQKGQLNIHMQLQPVVHLSPGGSHAEARWRDFGMEGEYQEWANWNESIANVEYVLEDGVWKIARLHLLTELIAPYSGGWAAVEESPKDWRSEASKRLPPDAPPSAQYLLYPEAPAQQFHYAPGEEQ